MPINRLNVFECRSLGSDFNAGMFDPGSTFNNTLSSANGTSSSPTVSASNYSFISQDVNHYLFIQSGTNWTPGWYQITGLAGTSAIVNASTNQYIKANYFRGKVNGIGTSNGLNSAFWTIDYSQSAIAVTSSLDLFVNTSTTCSSSSSPFRNSMIGNSLRINAGTNFNTGLFLITGIAGTIATLHRTIGTVSSTGGSAVVGGAAYSVTRVLTDGVSVIGNVDFRCFIKKDGTYYYSGGEYLFGGGYPNFFGYENYRDDRGKPLFEAIGYATRPFRRWDGVWLKLSNLEFNGNNWPSTTLAQFNNNQANSHFQNITFRNMRDGISGAGMYSKFCEFIDCQGYAGTISYGFVQGMNNSNNGSITAVMDNSIIWNNTTTHMSWPNPSAGFYVFRNNIVYNLRGAGNVLGSYENFNSLGNNYLIYAANNIFSNITGSVHYNVSGYSALTFLLDSNSYFSVGATGHTQFNSVGSSRYLVINCNILNNSPFANPENGNFRLNDHYLGGRLVRYKSAVSLVPETIIKQNRDVGPFQTRNSPISINMNGGMRG